MAAPEVLLYLNERSTGDSSLDWLSGWAVRYFARQLPRVSRIGIADPAVDESALAAALNNVMVERFSAGVTYDVIVTAAIDDTSRNLAHGGFLIVPESRLSEAAERDLPVDLIGRILGAKRLREAAERWRYRHWSKTRMPGNRPIHGERRVRGLGYVPASSQWHDDLAPGPETEDPSSLSLLRMTGVAIVTQDDGASECRCTLAPE